MRRLHKYKNYNKIELVAKFPLRILKFKRPKWNHLKDLFLNRPLLGKELIDITSITNECTTWDRVSQAYTERLKSYSFLSASLNNTINLKKLKKASTIKLRKDIYSNLYFRNYYKLCALTWFSNFFTSSFEAKQKIHAKKLTVNDKIATSNLSLNKGDIISISDNNIVVSSVFKKYNQNLNFITNIEIDYYTQNLIIVKDLTELSEEDYYLLCLDYINLQTLR